MCTLSENILRTGIWSIGTGMACSLCHLNYQPIFRAVMLSQTQSNLTFLNPLLQQLTIINFLSHRLTMPVYRTLLPRQSCAKMDEPARIQPNCA